jgi:hypothetical protein
MLARHPHRRAWRANIPPVVVFAGMALFSRR